MTDDRDQRLVVEMLELKVANLFGFTQTPEHEVELAQAQAGQQACARPGVHFHTQVRMPTVQRMQYLRQQAAFDIRQGAQTYDGFRAVLPDGVNAFL